MSSGGNTGSDGIPRALSTSIRDSSLLFCNDGKFFTGLTTQSFLLQCCEAKMMFFLGLKSVLKVLAFECFKIKAILSVPLRPVTQYYHILGPFYSVVPICLHKHMIKYLLLET